MHLNISGNQNITFRPTAFSNCFSFQVTLKRKNLVHSQLHDSEGGILGFSRTLNAALVCVVIKKSLRVNFVKLKPRPHFTGEKIFDDPFAQLKLQISELWMKELVEEMFLFSQY